MKGMMMMMTIMMLLGYTTRAGKCNGCLHIREAEVLVAAHQHARHPQLNAALRAWDALGVSLVLSPHWKAR